MSIVYDERPIGVVRYTVRRRTNVGNWKKMYMLRKDTEYGRLPRNSCHASSSSQLV